ncbi:MAG: hypothetical protein ACI9SQ_001827, partial [Rubritalea sp.]
MSAAVDLPTNGSSDTIKAAKTSSSNTPHQAPKSPRSS